MTPAASPRPSPRRAPGRPPAPDADGPRPAAALCRRAVPPRRAAARWAVVRLWAVAEPRRVLIDWDYAASGIWWVLTRGEMEAPAARGTWSGAPPTAGAPHPRPWGDLLPAELLDALRHWNDAWDTRDPDPDLLRRQGRDLAVQVQEELGTDGWEVLYIMGGRVRRVHPPGSWPLGSWKQDLLGYRPRRPPPQA